MIQSSFVSQRSPLFSILSQDQVHEIHRTSLEVLEKTGYRILCEEAVKLVKRAGARVEGEIVKTVRITDLNWVNVPGLRSSARTDL